MVKASSSCCFVSHLLDEIDVAVFSVSSLLTLRAENKSGAAVSLKCFTERSKSCLLGSSLSVRWLSLTGFFQYLADNPLVFSFLLIGVGMAVGHLRLKGVSLGPAAVLFLAIFAAAWAHELGVTIEVPAIVGTLGLALFAFSIGVTSGASFFHNLRTALGPILAMVGIMSGLAVFAYVVGVKIMGMPIAVVGGTYAGAMTNTPAMAAAGEAAGEPALATIGYSISYVFGVLGMLGAALAALAYGKHDTDKPAAIANRTVRVERSDHPFVGDIYEKMGGQITFSRLRRGEEGPIKRPAMSDTLDPGDLITVVGPNKLVAQAAKELGHQSSHSLMRDRSYLDFRRVTVSDPKIAGHSVGSLDLAQKYSATISRVRRGDVDLIGGPDVVLQLGDRVRVVAPTSKMGEITRFFGDSARGMSDINPIALGIGMALGLWFGHLPIPIPGGTLTIGAAAGTLIVGLIFGKVGRIGPMVTTLPYTASQVMLELGLLLFLTQAGAVAGTQIMAAFSSGMWLNIFILGFLITGLLAAGIYAVMRWVFHMGGTRMAGVLAGVQTQPAVLAFANTRTHDDPRVSLGYALVYPVAMVAKIVIAQLLGAFG